MLRPTCNKLLLNLASKPNKSVQRQFSLLTIHRQQQQQKKQPESAFSSLIQSSDSSNVSTHVTGAKRAKQAATDLTYLAVIATGGTMLAAIGYYLFTALFSRETPEGIYSESSKMCLNNPDVENCFKLNLFMSMFKNGFYF